MLVDRRPLALQQCDVHCRCPPCAPSSQNLVIVAEGERRQLCLREKSDLNRLGVSDGLTGSGAGRKRDVNDAAALFLIDAEQAVQLDRNAGLFASLADSGKPHVLTGVDKSRGEGPETHPWFMIASGKQNLPFAFRYDSDGDFGIVVVDVAAGWTGEAWLSENAPKGE
jgi:hypothetical protein